MTAHRSIVWTLFLCVGTVAPAALADRVVTVDGRVLKPNKAREEGEGYKLTWDAGEIVVKDKSLVKAVEIEGDMSDYVPKDEKEKEYLEKGFVLYRSKWMSKPAYEDALRKEFEESQALTEEMAKHSNFRNAWEEESKHFIVRTNTAPALLEYYLKLLETYYDLMDDRFGIKLSPAMRRTKMVVNIYKNRAEFHDLNAAGVGGGVAGYFSPSTLDLNFYHDYAEPAVSDWVCLHEGTHLLTHLIDPDYIAQIWVNEAVADYFGSADITRDKKGKLEITPGKLQTDRVLTVQQAIRDGNDIKLEDLFLITRDEFQAFEYAHAWSFVYFLNETKKYRKGFDKFFKDLYTLKKGIEFELVNYASQSGRGKRVSPQEIRRVLLASLKVKDTEKLAAEWKEFIAAVAIDGPEARFKRGYRAVILGQMYSADREKFAANRQMAQEDLDFAIEAGVGGARAYYARARLLQISAKGADAMDDLDKAIELDPLNATYRHAMADAMVRGSLDEVTAEKNPKVGPFLGLAAALAPDNEEYQRQYEHYLGK